MRAELDAGKTDENQSRMPYWEDEIKAEWNPEIDGLVIFRRRSEAMGGMRWAANSGRGAGRGREEEYEQRRGQLIGSSIIPNDELALASRRAKPQSIRFPRASSLVCHGCFLVSLENTLF